MSWLVDTNVVSEWVRPRPNPAVVAWLGQVDEDEVFMTVVSFAELRRGVALLDSPVRRQQLNRWIDEDLTDRFHRRILTVDLAVAEAWGRITADASRAGRPAGAMDAFFAATAQVHDLTLATRNVRDFAHLGVPLFNPWERQ